MSNDVVTNEIPDFVLELSNGKKLIETHISYVILDQHHVFKIKKSIRLDFLDFSTLEKRKFFCEEEIRLNTRLAPNVYLTTVQIRLNEHGHFFTNNDANAHGELVDYAVKMNRFEEKNLLTSLISNQTLASTTILDLGRRLAQFHKEDKSISVQDHFSRVQEMATENLEIASRYIGKTLSVEQHRIISKFTSVELEKFKVLIKDRGVNGRVKECHGDLHGNNIALVNGHLEAFDGIEFSDKYRYIDTMYDLAFLYMDLQQRGASEEANLLLNVYLEVSGDYEGAALIPLYACMRAVIRGYVTAMQAEIGDDASEENTTESKQFFELAHHYATSIKPSKIICTHGPSGIGKSTVARKLSKRIQAVILRSDAIRKIELKDISKTELYNYENTIRVYKRMIALGEFLYMNGWPIILDATFLQKEFRKLVLESYEKIPFVFLNLSAPAEMIKQRLAERDKDISDATKEVLLDQLEMIEPISSEENLPTISIDLSEEINIDKVILDL